LRKTLRIHLIACLLNMVKRTELRLIHHAWPAGRPRFDLLYTAIIRFQAAMIFLKSFLCDVILKIMCSTCGGENHEIAGNKNSYCY
jgi:hypothetical protein